MYFGPRSRLQVSIIQFSMEYNLYVCRQLLDNYVFFLWGDISMSHYHRAHNAVHTPIYDEVICAGSHLPSMVYTPPDCSRLQRLFLLASMTSLAIPVLIERYRHA